MIQFRNGSHVMQKVYEELPGFHLFDRENNAKFG